ncbi:hypothetical protein DL766_006459 [Monosporascus sp. MC13-8B]|uniref:Uncharacterized protein n=1 Tax=Monosporascus cannonballus TaxID=155416 RepID=A0ABY0H369_9PEZI|nr:hypothetical protein DL762_006061 [Monosporascus cannonballus]RYO84267.1 hypothetical protein DL763_007525 [Monosporascus cannonballus]RYP27247.1 hypothetical protein DL766_006459 [Monosporascus sp. MC13-8B]
MFRDTTVSGIPASYDKIFHVGHNFGSRLTYNLAATYADEAISDGITLTGFSHATSLTDTRLTAPISDSARNSSRRTSCRSPPRIPTATWRLATSLFCKSTFSRRGNFDTDILTVAFESASRSRSASF